MNRRYILLGVALIVLIGLYFIFAGGPDVVIDTDTTYDENFEVLDGEEVRVKDGAVITVLGDLNIEKGKLTCENGPIVIIVGGETRIQDTIECDRGETEDSDPGNGILIVANGSLTINEDAVIESDGNIQITESIDLLARTQGQLNNLYDSAELPSGDGKRVGPFTEEEEEGVRASNYPESDVLALGSLPFIGVAEAASHTFVASGKIRIKTPPKGVRRIVVFNFPTAVGVQVKNLSLTGPDGRAGTDDKGGSCNARGGDGENAFRFLALAPNIEVQSFKLTLGSGGKGGDAETGKDCDPGIAIGGKGGKAGNFKMVAGNKFEITGKFTINPGAGGAGGNAIAHGKEGGPGEDGGDADATGGVGADNKKNLSIHGTVAGTSNVEVGSLIAGNGGGATADPGKGGDGNKCGMKGGDGGEAKAGGGKGGDVRVTLAGNATRSSGAEDVGGDGGDADSHGGAAGNGGSCDPKGPGGNGGKGGDVVKAKAGEEGNGTTRNGNPGTVNDETGGDGGNGGDGCGEGKLGKGGKGNPPGEDGVDGKNICPKSSKPATSINSPGGSGVTVPGADSGTSGNTGTVDIELVELKLVSVEPITFNYKHRIGVNKCPDPIGGIFIDGEPGGTWIVDPSGIPSWLNIPRSGTLPGEVPLDFNCNISNFEKHTERARLNIVGSHGSLSLGDSFFDIFVDIIP